MAKVTLEVGDFKPINLPRRAYLILDRKQLKEVKKAVSALHSHQLTNAWYINSIINNAPEDIIVYKDSMDNPCTLKDQGVALRLKHNVSLEAFRDLENFLDKLLEELLSSYLSSLERSMLPTLF